MTGSRVQVRERKSLPADWHCPPGKLELDSAKKSLSESLRATGTGRVKDGALLLA